MNLWCLVAYHTRDNELFAFAGFLPGCIMLYLQRFKRAWGPLSSKLFLTLTASPKDTFQNSVPYF